MITLDFLLWHRLRNPWILIPTHENSFRDYVAISFLSTIGKYE